MSLKRVLRISAVIFVLLAVNILNADCRHSSNEEAKFFTNVQSSDAMALIKENSENPDFIILDVRTAEEFNSGHIKNAVNIDYFLDNFKAELDKLDKDKTYLIYCMSGSRSGRALQVMKKIGFRHVYNLEGGIIAWKSAGLPLVK